MESGREEDKIIPFPGSADKLVSSGLQLLKNGECEKALHHFSEALAHNPEHEEACYGLLLSYADSGHLQEGCEWAEQMLKKGIGNYFEVLQVYVSILAQLEDYDKVVSVLEAILEEEDFPPHMAEKLYELLELSHYMIRSDMEPFIKEENETSIDLCVNWKEKLQNGTAEQKMAVLRELRRQDPKKVLPAIESVLADSNSSPLMQSFLLLLLKDWNVEENIWVNKLNRQGEFSPSTLTFIEESSSYIKSTQLLEEALDQEDPVLLKNTLHLMRQLYLYYYPFPPALEMEAIAAVLHYDAAIQMGKGVTLQALAELYETEPDYVQNVFKTYEKIKEYMFDM